MITVYWLYRHIAQHQMEQGGREVKMFHQPQYLGLLTESPYCSGAETMKPN